MTSALDPSAYPDDFARRGLPPAGLWPVIDHEALGRLNYPKQFNAAVELLDRAVERGLGPRPCIRSPQATWSYAELLEAANRIAGVLVNEMGLVPGNRVLLRSANNPMLAACWFGVLKAGGIAVTTMPLLRSRELGKICNKAETALALCDARLAAELEAARPSCPALREIGYFNSGEADGLEALMRTQSATFDSVLPSHDDAALIAFTSGTTGPAKATVHFHRDLLCDLRHLARGDAAVRAGRRLCGKRPAWIHLRPRLAAAVSHAAGLLDRAAGTGGRRKSCFRRCRISA